MEFLGSGRRLSLAAAVMKHDLEDQTIGDIKILFAINPDDVQLSFYCMIAQ